VRDAIEMAVNYANDKPLTVLGDLVHNQTVVADLKLRGINFAQQPAEASTPTVMVTAHGASDKSIARAHSLGLHVLEATCPLVHIAHRALAKLVREGFHPVVIGKRGHVEVRGLTEDYPEFDIVLNDEDVAQLGERERFGVVAQTTQPIERVRNLVAQILRRFPRSEVRFIDTVCQPTKQRQHAAVELAQQCDVVVVVGGIESNNTRELVATCGRYCSQVHHVQSAAELCEEWFFTAATVGITAGTSTPDVLIEGVERRVGQIGALLQGYRESLEPADERHAL